MINFKKFFYKKRIIITGHTGFKGSWLTQWLKTYDPYIYGISKDIPTNPSHFKVSEIYKGIKDYRLDITNQSKVRNFFIKIKPHYVFHLAAQSLVKKSYKDPLITWNTNLIGTLNILESLRQLNNNCTAIIITSDKCYLNKEINKGYKETDILGGEDPYSGSKATAEIMVNVYYKSFLAKKNIGVASARAGNVIGGGDQSQNRLIPDIVNCLNKRKKIFIRNPDFNRPWQHVLDPLYGYLILAFKLYRDPKKFSGPWNFGTEKNTVTSVIKIVKYAIKSWGHGDSLINKEKKLYEQTNLQLNIDKSKKILKWKPKYKIRDSVKLTIDWYKKVLSKEITAEEITKKQISDYTK